MKNFRLELIPADRQQSISRLQSVESEISSPPTLLNAERFLADMRSFWGTLLRVSMIAAMLSSSFVRNSQQENENDH